MNCRNSIASLAFFFFVSSAFAADLRGAADLFSGQFRASFYKSGRCGENTETLIRLALRSGVDLSGASLVYLENKGVANFGLVAAYRAREQGAVTSSGAPGAGRRPGRANWSYHAFLLVNGRVLDFDFDNEPRVLQLQAYVAEMFLPPAMNGDFNRATELLKEYQVSLYRVRAVDPSQSFRVPRQELLENPRTMNLGDLLGL